MLYGMFVAFGIGMNKQTKAHANKTNKRTNENGVQGRAIIYDELSSKSRTDDDAVMPCVRAERNTPSLGRCFLDESCPHHSPRDRNSLIMFRRSNRSPNKINIKSFRKFPSSALPSKNYAWTDRRTSSVVVKIIRPHRLTIIPKLTDVPEEKRTMLSISLQN